jgi:RluA family pseudouridine synthase
MNPPELDIIWREGSLLVVRKPAGVASQGGEGLAGNNLVDVARAQFRGSQVAVLHRLDRNVSGLVMLALDAATARVMSAALKAQAITRKYVAVVRGKPERDAFEIDAWLEKDEKRNTTRVIAADEAAQLAPALRGAFKPALTRVVVRERFGAPLGKCALLGVQIVTGRSHQIRAHLAFVGLPIIGDPKYGFAAKGVARPLLHAEELGFVAPSGERVELRDEAPWKSAELRGLQKR